VSLAAVVLAAGEGTRLRPLTHVRPKALCPVAGVPLVDLAIDRVRPLVDGGAGLADVVAVNAHHLHEHLTRHLAGRVTLSVEMPQALGTAGALALLHPWLDGRDVVVTNADMWLDGSLTALSDGWDGERARLLAVRGGDGRGLGGWRYVGACVLPWRLVARLRPEPSGLYEVMWRGELEAGRLDMVEHHGAAIDCGTPTDYLRANLAAAGPGGLVSPSALVRGTAVDSVVGPAAQVDGSVQRCVVWDHTRVGADEHLVECIRADGLTVAAPLGGDTPS
jgi:NDP-sugar pyrophosphorylase family protein